MIKAVIFDFDGVVGDTMEDNFTAWQKSFDRYGFALPAAEYYRLEGMGRYQIAAQIISENNLAINSIEDIVSYKEAYYQEHNTFRLFAGIGDIFDLLAQKNVPVAIVTGASRSRITEHLDENMARQLAVLITADDVTHTKPHPEPYLAAVDHLGLSAAECLVIENAILGIQSAKAAGCMCFGLQTTLTREELSAADEIFATHHDLFLRLKSLF